MNISARTARITRLEIRLTARNGNVMPVQFADLNEGTKMEITWTTEQKNRLKTLNAGAGHRAGLYTDRKSTYRITAEQVIEIKKCIELKMSHTKIKKETGASEHHIRFTKKGKYNHLLIGKKGDLK